MGDECGPKALPRVERPFSSRCPRQRRQTPDAPGEPSRRGGTPLTAPKHLQVLLVEDSEDDALLLDRELRQAGKAARIERVCSAAGLRAALDERAWDVVLSDYNLPGFSGADALALLRERGLDTPFIFVSGSIGEEFAVAALKAGANDYVMKGNLTRLIPAIERELREISGRRARKDEIG